MVTCIFLTEKTENARKGISVLHTKSLYRAPEAARFSILLQWFEGFFYSQTLHFAHKCCCSLNKSLLACCLIWTASKMKKRSIYDETLILKSMMRKTSTKKDASCPSCERPASKNLTQRHAEAPMCLNTLLQKFLIMSQSC